MRQLLLLAFLSCSFSLSAQIYLDSLPLDPMFNDTVLSTPSVSVGYGQQNLQSFNGAVTHLEARQFNQGQINDWNQLWEAQVPGFTITRAGSNPNEAMDARIRGLHTLGANYGFNYTTPEPLYIVDGVPGADFFSVDPSDIVRVDVLRDIASTAIYGGRGTGGVVLISTRPVDNGPLKITYQGQVSVESSAKRYTVFNEPQFITAGGVDLSPGYIANTDWQSEILQTGVGHAHHLSASKSLGHGFVRAGLHYRDVTGVMRESGFEQYNGSVLAEQRFWHDRLTIGAGATLGQRVSNFGFPQAYRYAVSFAPSSPVRSDDPQYAQYGGYVQASLFDYFNPVSMLEQNHAGGRTDFHLLHARAALRIWRQLTAGLQISEQLQEAHDIEYYSPYNPYRGLGVNGRGVAENQKDLQKTLESTLNYRFRVGGWQADLLAGYGWYHNRNRDVSVTGVKLGDNTWEGKTWNQYRDLLAAHPGPDVSYFSYDRQSERQLTAFFSRAQVQWRNTYFGTFSWRKEGSSNLSPATRWGIFPAFTLGIDVNRWMPTRPFDYFKISVGHGVTGTELTQSGLFQRVYGQGVKFYNNGAFVPSYNIIQNPSDHLGWERTTENSLNLNLSIWNGRLQAAVNGYRYHSRDLIRSIQVAVPPNFSPTSVENIGELSGRGVELSLNYQLVRNQHLTWEVGFSATKAETIIENPGYARVAGYYFSDSIPYASPGYPCGCGTSLFLLYPGATPGTFWGPIAAELIGQGNQPFEDIDGIPGVNYYSFNGDQTKLGDAEPSWQLGLQQKLTWRNLDLTVQLQAVTGHQIYNNYRHAYESNSSNYSNRVITQYYNPDLLFAQFNNRLVEDASFLRIQYVSLGYRLPINRKWLQSLHFQLGAQNLATFTQYTGLNPDLRLYDNGSLDNGSYGFPGHGDVLAPGLDRGSYPTARRWWLGVEAAF